MSVHRFVKEVSKLAQRVDKLFGGVVELDLEGLEDEHFHFRVSPKTGIYAGAEFMFKYEYRGDDAPYITTVYSVDHPNFYEDDGEICFNMLDEEFTSDYTIEGFLVGMLFLIDNPNFEDPACDMFSYNDFRENERTITQLIYEQEIKFEDQVIDYSKGIVQSSLQNIYESGLADYELDLEDKLKEDNASLGTADTDDELMCTDLCPLLKHIIPSKFPVRKARMPKHLTHDSEILTGKALMLNSYSPLYTMFTQFASHDHLI